MVEINCLTGKEFIMTRLIKFLTLALIFVYVNSVFAQNTNPGVGTDKNSDRQAKSEGQKGDEDRRLDRPPLIFVKADREKIYMLLAEQMKQQEFKLTKKDVNKIVFSKRTPGADAAISRKQYDRTVNTPIIDDPQIITAFILTEKNNGFVVAGRMIVTTIFPGSRVASFDVSDQKGAKVSLNRMLEMLVADNEKRSK